MTKISVLHGPNLNLLGMRETSIYGKKTLNDINSRLTDIAKEQGIALTCFQSHAEHELITFLHNQVLEKTDFIIFNPAAFTHTSVALRDALLAIAIPFIEVHLSNVYAREAFRHVSYFRDIAVGTLAGFGPLSYELALYAAIDYLQNR